MLRAVWSDIARDFNDKRDIEAFAAWCERNGITVTFPCVNHATGLVTYPSDVAPRSAQFDDWDPLPDLLKTCHTAGIEVHPWICCMHWGPQRFSNFSKTARPSHNGPRPLQETHRDWFAVNHLGQSVLDEAADGETIQLGGLLNLGLSPVHDFLEKLCAEVLDRYAVDGVHLDYIRSNTQREEWIVEVPAKNKIWAAADVGDIFQMRPRSGRPKEFAAIGFRALEIVKIEESSGESAEKHGSKRRLFLAHVGRYGFNEPLMRDFEKDTGIAWQAAGTDAPERVAWLYQNHRAAWQAWKAGQITALVRRLSRLTRNRRCKLSAAVFDDIHWCGQETAQRWHEWCNEKLLDFVCPMDYGKKGEALARCLDKQNSFLAEPRIPSLAGILTGCGIMDLTREDLAACEAVARAKGQAGVCLFCYGGWKTILP